MIFSFDQVMICLVTHFQQLNISNLYISIPLGFYKSTNSLFNVDIFFKIVIRTFTSVTISPIIRTIIDFFGKCLYKFIYSSTQYTIFILILNLYDLFILYQQPVGRSFQYKKLRKIVSLQNHDVQKFQAHQRIMTICIVYSNNNHWILLKLPGYFLSLLSVQIWYLSITSNFISFCGKMRYELHIIVK